MSKHKLTTLPLHRWLAYGLLTSLAIVAMWPQLRGMNIIQVSTVAVCLLVGMIITDM